MIGFGSLYPFYQTLWSPKLMIIAGMRRFVVELAISICDVILYCCMY
jgi:hypothetical protein